MPVPEFRPRLTLKAIKNRSQSKLYPPVNIPIPTKIGSNLGGEFTYPKLSNDWFSPTAISLDPFFFKSKNRNFKVSGFSAGGGDIFPLGSGAPGEPPDGLGQRPGPSRAAREARRGAAPGLRAERRRWEEGRAGECRESLGRAPPPKNACFFFGGGGRGFSSFLASLF